MQNLLIGLALFSLIGGGIAAVYVFLAVSWALGLGYAVSALASYALFITLSMLLDGHHETRARLERLERKQP